MRVNQIMSKHPTCCTPHCTVQLAANLMREARTGFLPVLEKFSRKLVGVVTDHDLCLTVCWSKAGTRFRWGLANV